MRMEWDALGRGRRCRHGLGSSQALTRAEQLREAETGLKPGLYGFLVSAPFQQLSADCSCSLSQGFPAPCLCGS